MKDNLHYWGIVFVWLLQCERLVVKVLITFLLKQEIYEQADSVHKYSKDVGKANLLSPVWVFASFCAHITLR